MTKYNVGDVLEITESFFLEGAQFKAGQKYTVEDVFAGYGGEDFYTLDDKESGYHFINKAPLVDAHSGFSKVEPKVVFKVGDKVRLLEGAHGSPELAFSWSTEEGFEKNFGYRYDLAEPFVVHVEIDYAGEVGISQDELNSYVLSEFLVPWDEAEPELKEPFLQHMVLGKTYQSTSNDFFYTPTAFDFESERVAFDFVSEPGSFVSKSDRPFYEIELEFGVLPPVKTVGVSQVALDEVKTETQVEPKFKVGQVWRNSHDRELSITEVDGSHITYAYTGNESPFYRRAENTEGWTLDTQEVTLSTIAEAVQEEFASAAPKPETVSVVALREAMDYLGIQEVFDTENIIALAKRLS